MSIHDSVSTMLQQVRMLSQAASTDQERRALHEIANDFASIETQWNEALHSLRQVEIQIHIPHDGIVRSREQHAGAAGDALPIIVEMADSAVTTTPPDSPRSAKTVPLHNKRTAQDAELSDIIPTPIPHSLTQPRRSRSLMSSDDVRVLRKIQRQEFAQSR